ncbi:hypothetical protein HDU76_009705, partial [Blyttiomyces sp. JEL0837]
MKKAILYSSKPRIAPLTSVKALPPYGRMDDIGDIFDMERSEDGENVTSSESSRAKLESLARTHDDSLVEGDATLQYRPDHKASASISTVKQLEPPLHSIIKGAQIIQRHDSADGLFNHKASSTNMANSEEHVIGDDETKISDDSGPQQPQRQRLLSTIDQYQSSLTTSPIGNEEFRSSHINVLTEHIHKIALQEETTHDINKDNSQPTSPTKKKIRLPVNKSLKLLESLSSILELCDDNITSIGIEGLAYTIAELMSKLSAIAVIFMVIGGELLYQQLQPSSTTSTCTDTDNDTDSVKTIAEAISLLATTLLIENPYTFWEESQVGYDLMDVVRIFWKVKLGLQTYGTYLCSVGAALAAIMAVEAG